MDPTKAADSGNADSHAPKDEEMRARGPAIADPTKDADAMQAAKRAAFDSHRKRVVAERVEQAERQTERKDHRKRVIDESSGRDSHSPEDGDALAQDDARERLAADGRRRSALRLRAEEIKRRIDEIVSLHEESTSQGLRSHCEKAIDRIFGVALGVAPQKRRRRELMLRIHALALVASGEPVQAGLRLTIDPPPKDEELYEGIPHEALKSIVEVWLPAKEKESRKQGGAKKKGKRSKWKALASLIKKYWDDDTPFGSLEQEWKAMKR